MAYYELAILGRPTDAERLALETSIGEMVSAFGMTLGGDVTIHDASTVATRDERAAFSAAYFGSRDQHEAGVASALVAQSLPVIPVVSMAGNFISDIPAELRSLNGLELRATDPQLTVLASAMLECIGLLRRQRRIFISYRRVESRAVAMQLHDLLSARGFDVFLDTHDIRAGEPFQDVLWNRLCDSDVLVMLDTPTYFESKWTRHEIGRARAKEIQVLRVIWPDHTPNRLTDLSETIHLDKAELIGPEGPLVDGAAEQIVLAVEGLRSRSIAARYMSITGKLRADVEMIGAAIEGIGAHRAISIRLLDDARVWAYPVVGIPTADLLNDVANKARQANQVGTPILVYDHVGIRNVWAEHLSWLDANIKSVRAIKVSEAGWTLAAWEG